MGALLPLCPPVTQLLTGVCWVLDEKVKEAMAAAFL